MKRRLAIMCSAGLLLLFSLVAATSNARPAPSSSTLQVFAAASLSDAAHDKQANAFVFK